MRSLLLFAALSALTCGPDPREEDCAASCKRLRECGLEEGQPQGKRTCERTCLEVEQFCDDQSGKCDVRFGNACFAAAEDCDAVRVCARGE